MLAITYINLFLHLTVVRLVKAAALPQVVPASNGIKDWLSPP